MVAKPLCLLYKNINKQEELFPASIYPLKERIEGKIKKRIIFFTKIFLSVEIKPVLLHQIIIHILYKEMKEVLIVSIGSFFGGGMRYWVSKMVQSCTVIAFPFGTMAVNVAGCLIIGFLSGLNWREGGWMSPSAKLLLTTGFCGGFTTFSTFMNEGAGLMKEENYLYMMLYLFGNLALGLIAVLAGHYLAKMIA